MTTTDTAPYQPLLIAIHGQVNAGKSHLAGQIASEVASGGRVEGWLQIAGRRDSAQVGAEDYALQFIGSSAAMFVQPIAYLTRDQQRQPPYRVLDESAAPLRAWQQAVAADERTIDLLVFDEFGSIEAKGEGHLQRWLSLREREPGAVIVVVHSSRLALVEAALGQAFDVRVDAGDAHALEQLRDVLVARRDFERVGWFGALAGAFEVGAGSIVHGAKIPFGGLGMATTQAALLTRAAEPMADRGRVVWVALLSAGIKSMSPAGQRIRPMLAIAIQGWLYSRALRWLGWNFWAVMLGGFLMGAWAGSQGLFMQWLLVGDALAVALNQLSSEIAQWVGASAPSLAGLIGVWIAAHGAIVAAGTGLAWRRRHLVKLVDTPSRWQLPLLNEGKRGWLASIGRGLRELARPTFWLPLLLILAALAWAGQSQQSLVFVALRAIVIGWILFVLIQRLDFRALPGRLRRLGMWGPAIAWRRALSRLQAQQKRS